jgi:hypothetical protein
MAANRDHQDPEHSDISRDTEISVSNKKDGMCADSILQAGTYITVVDQDPPASVPNIGTGMVASDVSRPATGVDYIAGFAMVALLVWNIKAAMVGLAVCGFLVVLFLKEHQASKGMDTSPARFVAWLDEHSSVDGIIDLTPPFHSVKVSEFEEAHNVVLLAEAERLLGIQPNLVSFKAMFNMLLAPMKPLESVRPRQKEVHDPFEDWLQGTSSLNLDALYTEAELKTKLQNDEIRDRTLKGASHHVRNQVHVIDTIREELRGKESEVDALCEQLKGKDSDIKDIRCELSEKNAEIAALRDEIIVKDFNSDVMSQEIDDKNYEVKGYSDKLDETEASLESVRCELREKTSEIDSIRAELREKKALVKEQKKDLKHLGKYLEEKDAQICEQDEEILILKGDLESEKFEKSNLEAKGFAKDAKIFEQEQMIKHLKDQLAGMESQKIIDDLRTTPGNTAKGEPQTPGLFFNAEVPAEPDNKAHQMPQKKKQSSPFGIKGLRGNKAGRMPQKNGHEFNLDFATMAENKGSEMPQKTFPFGLNTGSSKRTEDFPQKDNHPFPFGQVERESGDGKQTKADPTIELENRIRQQGATINDRDMKIKEQHEGLTNRDLKINKMQEELDGVKAKLSLAKQEHNRRLAKLIKLTRELSNVKWHNANQSKMISKLEADAKKDKAHIAKLTSPVDLKALGEKQFLEKQAHREKQLQDTKHQDPTFDLVKKMILAMAPAVEYVPATTYSPQLHQTDRRTMEINRRRVGANAFGLMVHCVLAKMVNGNEIQDTQAPLDIGAFQNRVTHFSYTSEPGVPRFSFTRESGWRGLFDKFDLEILRHPVPRTFPNIEVRPAISGLPTGPNAPVLQPGYDWVESIRYWLNVENFRWAETSQSGIFIDMNSGKWAVVEPRKDGDDPAIQYHFKVFEWQGSVRVWYCAEYQVGVFFNDNNLMVQAGDVADMAGKARTHWKPMEDRSKDHMLDFVLLEITERWFKSPGWDFLQEKLNALVNVQSFSSMPNYLFCQNPWDKHGDKVLYQAYSAWN